MNADPVPQESITPTKSKKTWVIVLIAVTAIVCVCLAGVAVGAGGYLFFQNYEIEFNGDNSKTDAQSEVSPTRQAAAPAKPANPTPIPTHEPTRKPTAKVPTAAPITLGDEVRLEKCGYSFKKVPDFTFKHDGKGCSPSMYISGTNEAVPPSILFSTTIASNAKSYMRDQVTYINNTTGYKIISKNKVKIGGMDADIWDLEIKKDGQTSRSQMILVMVAPHQYFQISAIASSENWEKVHPYFDAVVGSVTFFTPE